MGVTREATSACILVPAYRVFGDSLKNDKEVVLMAVKEDWHALMYASADLKNNKEVVLAAVGMRGIALAWASSDPKNDKEVVLMAVKGNGNALQYASSDLKNDKEVVLAAVKQNASAFEYASEELRSDEYLQSWSRLSEGKTMWRVLRGHFRWLEPISWWWVAASVENAYSEGGAGRKREREAYTAEFDPSEVEDCSSGLKPENMD